MGSKSIMVNLWNVKPSNGRLYLKSFLNYDRQFKDKIQLPSVLY